MIECNYSVGLCIYDRMREVYLVHDIGIKRIEVCLL